MGVTEPAATPSHLHVVVMGVSGTGKSTVARALSTELDLVMTDGDDHHPVANIAKMASGTPLDDADRARWLAALARWTEERHAADEPTVLTCSALRRRYRDVLRAAVPEPTIFVHLAGSTEVLAGRMADRSHFMPPTLLDSQLRTLEPLEDDEIGGMVDTDLALDSVVRDAVTLVQRASA
ncbi:MULTISPECIES: gluconokinase [Nocardioides]|uniref:Gluconokinase n=1 Tax=Nocardioides vastitatis TaxID=2568655 RepID=A0ABW0ZIH9_9ACTN|nr:gluconokinase [Nocardioides sp.]THJ04506.1 gluconokinase [Nocardioides sp.]